MTGTYEIAILAAVRDRGIVTLEWLCRSLFGLRVEQIAPSLLDEIEATLIQAGWIHSSRAADGVVPVDVYERPIQDIATAQPRAPAASIAQHAPSATTILREAAQAIEDRAVARDMQAERSMARTVAAFNALTGHALTERDGWLFMVTLKAARATAGAHNGDDYTDGSAYFALAGECAAKVVS